jgi:perosamine synthetase
MIPVCEPNLDSTEFDIVAKCMRSGWIAGGEYVTEFEQLWASYCGMRAGVAVTNGTVALELALAALELEPGSEVIMPSFTIVSCALAAIRNKLTPVYVDVEPDTWCIDPAQVEKSISARTKVLMPVHMYGHPCDMSRLMAVARRRGLIVVEDAAQAHGATVQLGGNDDPWSRCGGIGDLSCFSFYSNKILTTGEGGMVLASDPKYIAKLQSLRNLCFGSGNDRFIHTGIGTNARMTNLQAAIGVAQVAKVDAAVARKRELARNYRRLITNPQVQHPTERSGVCNVYWMYGILVNEPLRVAAHLKQRGIETRPFFTGLHAQPALREYQRSSDCSFPVTEDLTARGLYLPSGVQLTPAMQEQVADALAEIL